MTAMTIIPDGDNFRLVRERELVDLIRDLGAITDRMAGVYEASLCAALLDRVLTFMDQLREGE